MIRDVEADLKNETLKWLVKAEYLYSEISPKDNRFAENIAAYISDSRHFLNNGDLIRAFEAVIWAWAWMEIGQEIGLLCKAE
jgi:hypothetical protein